MQINSVARLAAAFANAICQDREWVLGKVIRGTARGGKADIVI
jgi:hypothetical protein